MTIDPTVTTVAEARDNLSRVLRRFRSGDATPLVLGSHRKPEAVIVPFSWHNAAGSISPAPTIDSLRARRQLINRLASFAHLTNVRVTGSVARGEASENSDIDFIVDPLPEASLFTLAQFADDLEQLLGRRVDVLSSRSLTTDDDARLLADAVSL